MCITTERESTICGHVARHTHLCTEKKNQSILKIFRLKCAPSTQRTVYYEICHGCRNLWLSYGIGEIEAIELTRAYRAVHNCICPITPRSFDGEEPYLMQDIDINSVYERKGKAESLAKRINQVAKSDTNLTEWLVNGGEDTGVLEIPAGHQQDLTEWLVRQAMEDAPSSKRESFASSITLWPRMSGADFDDTSNSENGKCKERKMDFTSSDVPGRPNSLTHPDNFKLDAGLVNHNNFELVSLQRPPPAKADAHGFQRQQLHVPLPYRATAHPGSSHQDTRDLRRTKFTEIKLSPPDLDKPLPPPPKRDSTTPRQPFNNQKP
jgi:hypothetical protein